MSDILRFSMNIADAEAPPQLPAGEYRATCVGAKVTESKSSGNPLLPLEFVIKRDQFPADFDSDADEWKGTYNRLTVRDNGNDRYRLKGVCRALGVPMSDTIDPNDFIMKECRVKIAMGKDLEGNPRAEIAAILEL
jgi:Protein of unknown function (DUF669)